MTKLEILNKDESFDKEIECNTEKSILDNMLDNNSQIFYGCMGGSCGACICNIIEGEENIDKEALHKTVFKGVKDKQFLPCIAKVKDSKEKIIIQKVI